VGFAAPPTPPPTSNAAPLPGLGCGSSAGGGGADPAATFLLAKGPSFAWLSERALPSVQPARRWTLFGTAPVRTRPPLKVHPRPVRAPGPTFWDADFFDVEEAPRSADRSLRCPGRGDGDGSGGHRGDCVGGGNSSLRRGGGEKPEPPPSSPPHRPSVRGLSVARLHPPEEGPSSGGRPGVGRVDVARFNGYVAFKRAHLAEAAAAQLDRGQTHINADRPWAAAAAAGLAWRALSPSLQAPWHDAALVAAGRAARAVAAARRQRRRLRRQRARGTSAAAARDQA